VIGVGVTSGGGEHEGKGRESSAEWVVSLTFAKTGQCGFFGPYVFRRRFVGVHLSIFFISIAIDSPIGGVYNVICGRRGATVNRRRRPSEGGVEDGTFECEACFVDDGFGVVEFGAGFGGGSVNPIEEVRNIFGGKAAGESLPLLATIAGFIIAHDFSVLVG